MLSSPAPPPPHIRRQYSWMISSLYFGSGHPGWLCRLTCGALHQPLLLVLRTAGVTWPSRGINMAGAWKAQNEEKSWATIRFVVSSKTALWPVHETSQSPNRHFETAGWVTEHTGHYQWTTNVWLVENSRPFWFRITEKSGMGTVLVFTDQHWKMMTVWRNRLGTETKRSLECA